MYPAALILSILPWLLGLSIFVVSAWFERVPERPFAKALFWLVGLMLVCVGAGLIARFLIFGAIHTNPVLASNDILAISSRVIILLAPFYAAFVSAQLARSFGRKMLNLPPRKLAWLPPTKSSKAP